MEIVSSRPDVMIDITYDQGVTVQLHSHGALEPAWQEALEKFREVQWLPEHMSLGMLSEALKEAGARVQLSPEAEALRQLFDRLVDDDEMSAWTQGDTAPRLPHLQSSLRPHQLRGAAFLAFRRRALLCDGPALEPTYTAVAAAQLAYALERRKRKGLSLQAPVVIVAPESRHGLWIEAIETLARVHPDLAPYWQGRQKMAPPRTPAGCCSPSPSWSVIAPTSKT